MTAITKLEVIKEQYANGQNIWRRSSVAYLLDQIEDLNGYYDNIMATSGHGDELHCACVPALRRKVDGLTARVERLEAAARKVKQMLATDPDISVAKARMIGMLIDAALEAQS